MKILLVGEYSGLHSSLAFGLRKLGHDVVLASDGDSWKGFKRDIDLERDWCKSKLTFVFKLIRNLKYFRGYEVVQLINPNFIMLKPFLLKIIFKYLKKYNKSVFLGANGTDSVFIRYGLSGRYSKSILNQKILRSDPMIVDYINKQLIPKNERLNRYIADRVDGITAVCAEYYIAYKAIFPQKTIFIPLPIDTKEVAFCNTVQKDTQPLKFFLGHLKKRSKLKGTDIIEEALKDLKRNYEDQIELQIVSGVPYDEYINLLNSSHVLCDQLYSYGCGVNGVIGLSKGLIVVGGGDEGMYKLFKEIKNKPIVDLPSQKEDVYKELEKLLLNKSSLYKKALNSRRYAEKHHDVLKIAKKYEQFWMKMMNSGEELGI